MSAGMSNRPIVSHLKLSFLINSPPHPHSPIPPHSLVCNRDTAVPCVCVDCLIGKQKKSPRPVWTSLPTPPRPLYSKRPCDFPNDSVWKTCGNEICAIFVINDSAPGKDTLLHSRVSFPGRVNTSHLRIPYCFNTPP